MTDRLSTKAIPPRERLILALDVPSAEEGLALVDRLGDSVHFYKIGLELFMAGGYFELLRALADRGKRVFADLKESLIRSHQIYASLMWAVLLGWWAWLHRRHLWKRIAPD